MKVKELRKKLKAFDPDLDVEVSNIDTLGDDLWEPQSLYRKAERYSIHGNTPATVVISGTDE